MASRARQRTDGRWQIRIELGVQPGKDGVPRRRQHYVYGQTKREVERKAREAERALEEGRSVTSDRQTVAQFLESWLETKRYKRPKTFRHYDHIVRCHLIPLLGHLRLGQLHARDVQKALDTRAAAGAAPRTVHHLRAVLRNALNQAVEWRILAHNPAVAVELPALTPHELPVVSPDQRRAFLGKLDRSRLAPLFRAAILLGFREGELLGLRWEDVDLDSGVLALRKQLVRVKGQVELAELKTKSRRTVPLPPALVRLLQQHRLNQEADRLAARERWQDWGLVFPSQHGTPLWDGNVRRSLYALERTAGLPKLTFHDLRHLTSTLLLSRGHSLKLVQEQLGHRTAALTLGIYGHLLPGDQAAALDDLARFLLADGGPPDQEGRPARALPKPRQPTRT